MKLRPGQIALRTYCGLVVAFLLIPLFVVVPLSFNPKSYNVFPPPGVSLRWFQDFIDSPEWIGSMWLSLRVGVAAGALATLLGLMASIALTRLVTRGKLLLFVLILSPAIVPVILMGIAVFDIYTRLGLQGTVAGLIIAHTILGIPFTTLIIMGRLASVDMNIEDAAVSLGASRPYAFVRVVLPSIAPSLFAAGLIAFIISFDELVLALFLGGADLIPLPVRMFTFLTTHVRPTIAAISTMLLLATLLVFIAVQLWPRLRRSRIPPDARAGDDGDARV